MNRRDLKIIPVLFCTIYPDGRILTEKCPVCGLRHEHGGELEWEAYQGLRNAHCPDTKEYPKYALIASNLIPKDIRE